jgi:hypothetical protein
MNIATVIHNCVKKTSWNFAPMNLNAIATQNTALPDSFIGFNIIMWPLLPYQLACRHTWLTR